MLSYTLFDAANNPYDIGEHFLYVIRDGEEVFYVGQSYDPLERLLQHLGYDLPWYPDLIGSLIHDNLPLARDWTIDLYTIPDCVEIVKTVAPESIAFYLGNMENRARISHLKDIAEQALMDSFKPYLNVLNNSHNRRQLPERYVKKEAVNKGVKLE